LTLFLSLLNNDTNLVNIITSSGYALDEVFLKEIQQERGGVILVEASAETKEPLRLDVIKKSTQRSVANAELALNISNVEEMYRNIDLKGLATRPGKTYEPGLVENINEPRGNPDTRTKANYLVFMHGYDVSSEAARGWNAEMFKRFHRLGFNGRFIATNWHSKTGLDYHYAVYNAFQTGMGLNSKIKSAIQAEPGPITIAAHSLGNVVASNAISYGGLTPKNYFMINAAVPIEAYDSTQDTDTSGTIMKENMTEKSWKEYPDSLYASNWYELFSSNTEDDRRKLTWKNYFNGAVSVAYNFYSPGEDVVENAIETESFNAALWQNILDGELSQHTWVMQEMGKGFNSLGSWYAFKCSGGWKFNKLESDLDYIGKPNPLYDETDPENTVSKSLPYANALEATLARDNSTLTDDALVQYGFFSKFSHFENGVNACKYLYQPISNAVTLPNEQHQWDLLASAIPAMSFAAAANSMSSLINLDTNEDKNFNMESLRGDIPAWPTIRSEDPKWATRWRHSDIRNVALPYVYHTFEKMLTIGVNE